MKLASLWHGFRMASHSQRRTNLLTRAGPALLCELDAKQIPLARSTRAAEPSMACMALRRGGELCAASWRSRENS
jgi:hypothetical protein